MPVAIKVKGDELSENLLKRMAATPDYTFTIVPESRAQSQDALQALLNFKAIKGKRPVVDVIREIRESE